MTEKLTENSSDIPLSAAAQQQQQQPQPSAFDPAAAANPSFFRWILEGLRASVLLRARIGPDASPGPWKLALLVLIANLIELSFERISFAEEVQFNYEGWLNQWGSCLLVLWVAWCFLPRAGRPAAPPVGGARVLSWFALMSWALLPLLVLAYCYQSWVQFADDSAVETWERYISPTTVAAIWGTAVFLKLSRAFFASWLRTLAMSLVLCVSTVAVFWSIQTDTWVAAEAEAAQPEVVPGDEESDDGGAEEEDMEQPELLEALRHEPPGSALTRLG